MTRHSSLHRAAWRSLSAAAVIATLLVACDKSTPQASAVKPEVSTNLAKLRALVPIPPDVTSARWLVRPLRHESSRLVPGPSEGMLLAYFDTSSSFWLEYAQQFAEVKGPAQRFRAADMEALLPPSVLNTAMAMPIPGEYQLNCIRVSPEALSSATSRAVEALHCGAGLLVSFASQ